MPDSEQNQPSLMLTGVELLNRLIERQVNALHEALVLHLNLTLGDSEGSRIVDGAKDAVADFLTDQGHTPELLGEKFDFVAQALLECVFMQNPSLMGPDGTVPISEEASAVTQELPQRVSGANVQSMDSQRRREEATGWEVGDHTKRPHSPDGWQPGGR